MDLDAIEAWIRNPPSASLETAKLLQLVAYARELKTTLFEAQKALIAECMSKPSQPHESTVDAFKAAIEGAAIVPPPGPLVGAKPTPPETPKRKAKR